MSKSMINKEAVILPLWVWEIMLDATRAQKDDIEAGIEDGLYDEPENHLRFIKLDVAHNFDPKLFHWCNYDREAMMQTWKESYAREWMEKIARRHGWTGLPEMSLEMYLSEMRQVLTHYEKLAGRAILQMFDEEYNVV